MNNLILSLLFFLASCSNVVNQVHRKIDHEEKRMSRKSSAAGRDTDRYAAYRGKNRFRTDKDKRPIKNPHTYSLGAGPSGQQRPPVKREYRPQRYNAQDFRDGGENDGSLWANQGSSSSLFTYQNEKHTGDMIIINVLEDMRNQISSELKRTFPDKPKVAADSGASKKVEDKVATAQAAPAAPEQEMDMKVYDKISGTVMEEVSKDYILLRGRKDVIFKKEKRAIEVQALVSRKDIMENDYVNSDKLLESRIFILNKDEQ
jgi:flagellar L-ring protein precursor FlgH